MASKGRRLAKVGPPARKEHPGFPGGRTLKMVDLILFLADSRIPWTSVRLAEPYLGAKRRVYVLTKPDLANKGLTQQWLEVFSESTQAFAVNCRSGQGLPALLRYLRDAWQDLGSPGGGAVEKRPLRIMLFGAPNVGKSSLGNRLLGSQKAPFGARPGLTRGSHWLKGREFLLVLDTPGVLDTSLVKGTARTKLAAAWALRENAYDAEEVALWLAGRISGPELKPLDYLKEFGRSRGFLGAGGALDMTRTFQAFVREFQEGTLGSFTLEKPEDFPASPGPPGHLKGAPGEQ